MNLRINLRIISVLLSLILWFYVNIFLSPPTQRVLTAPIEFKNLPAKMKMTAKEDKVELVLSGTRREFIFSGRSWASAAVDLYSLRPGSLFFPVKVLTPPGLSVIAMKPAQIEVIGEILSSRDIELTLDVKGIPAEGFIAAPPIASPTTVTVEGPREYVDKITQCRISTVLPDIRNSVSESKRVQVFAGNDEITGFVRVTPEKVDLTIPVKVGYPAKSLPVVPQFLNKTQEGQKLGSYTISPPEMQITGPQRILDQLGDLRTSPIDLSLLSSSSTLITLVEVPPFENTALVGSNTATVQIQLLPQKLSKIFPGLPLALKNDANQFCALSPASYTIILRGFSEDLQKINTSELHLELDARDLKPGTFSVPLPIPSGLPAQLEVVEILPAKAVITVAKPEPDTASPPSSTP
jgi:YbbR domain-containing protein